MSEASIEGQSDEPGRKRRRRLWLTALAVVFVGAAVAYGAWWLLVARYYVTTDDAYVHGNSVNLMAQLSGTVASVNTRDTDLVTRGQSLVVLDRSTAELALGRAEAQLADTVRQVRGLYDQRAEQQATVALEAARLAQARRDYARARKLVGTGAVSHQQYQHAQTTFDVAKSAYTAAVHRLAQLRAATDNTDLADHPKVVLAEDGVRDAWLALQRHTLPAPVTGFVAQRAVQVGQRITPGDRLLAIVPLDQIWVQANYKETDLTDVRIGQPVTITADFYGSDVVYHGSVIGISPGTGSAFELLPPQNATGNWIKVIRRVPVMISLDPDELKHHPLRLGLSLQVSIDVHDTSGAVLAPARPAAPVYRTDVYKHSQKAVDALIDAILHANGGAESDRGG